MTPYLDHSNTWSHRPGNCTHHIRNKFSAGADSPEKENLTRNTYDLVEFLRDVLKVREFPATFDLGLPMIAADRVQLHQLLMNLMLNGIDAMKDTRGDLTVTSRRTEDGQIQIAVGDSGCGLPIDGRERLFEASFTTKPQGTGMGLCFSRRTIESHGGCLSASANTGRGATFLFTLPSEGDPRSST